jgi:hypothetical protein
MSMDRVRLYIAAPAIVNKHARVAVAGHVVRVVALKRVELRATALELRARSRACEHDAGLAQSESKLIARAVGLQKLVQGDVTIAGGDAQLELPERAGSCSAVLAVSSVDVRGTLNSCRSQRPALQLPERAWRCAVPEQHTALAPAPEPARARQRAAGAGAPPRAAGADALLAEGGCVAEADAASAANGDGALTRPPPWTLRPSTWLPPRRRSRPRRNARSRPRRNARPWA